MELLEFLEFLLFAIFMLLFFFIFIWVDYLFNLCRRIGVLNWSFLYIFLFVLFFGIDLILEVSGVWESASVYVLQLLSYL